MPYLIGHYGILLNIETLMFLSKKQFFLHFPRRCVMCNTLGSIHTMFKRVCHDKTRLVEFE